MLQELDQGRAPGAGGKEKEAHWVGLVFERRRGPVTTGSQDESWASGMSNGMGV